MGLTQIKAAVALQQLSLSQQSSLIWLDHFAENDPIFLQAQKRLRSSINRLQYFRDPRQCKHVIKNHAPNNHFILIINDEFAPMILPSADKLPQVSSIYVRITRAKEKGAWQKLFSKVNSFD